MSISQKLNELIESKMSSLDSKSILRSQRSYNDFSEEYSRILAQAQMDRSILEASGFNFSVMEEYQAILEKMAEIHSERIASIGSVNKATKEFRNLMPKAKEDRNVLSFITRYLIDITQNIEIKNLYSNIRSQSTHLDILQGNISLVALIKKHIKIASQIRPGGKTIDNEFLDIIHQRAMHLVALKGQADTTNNKEDISVEKLKRIVSLAVSAEKAIKLFAKIAFYDDIKRYKSKYVSKALRARNSSYYKSRAENPESKLLNS